MNNHLLIDLKCRAIIENVGFYQRKTMKEHSNHGITTSENIYLGIKTQKDINIESLRMLHIEWPLTPKIDRAT